MFKVLNNNTGVLVNLTNKTIIFLLNNTIIQTTQITPNYIVPNFVNSQLNSTLFTPASIKTSKASKNVNIVQKLNRTYTLINSYTNNDAATLLNWFFKKIKYQGKGLKIKKSVKKTTILFNLGSSHTSIMFFDYKSATLLRTKKNTFTALFFKKSNYISNKLTSIIRPYNIYTKRGVRVARQIMYRRFGKVSQIAPKKR